MQIALGVFTVLYFLKGLACKKILPDFFLRNSREYLRNFSLEIPEKFSELVTKFTDFWVNLIKEISEIPKYFSGIFSKKLLGIWRIFKVPFFSNRCLPFFKYFILFILDDKLKNHLQRILVLKVIKNFICFWQISSLKIQNTRKLQ